MKFQYLNVHNFSIIHFHLISSSPNSIFFNQCNKWLLYSTWNHNLYSIIFKMTYGSVTANDIASANTEDAMQGLMIACCSRNLSDRKINLTYGGHLHGNRKIQIQQLKKHLSYERSSGSATLWLTSHHQWQLTAVCQKLLRLKFHLHPESSFSVLQTFLWSSPKCS